MVQIQTDNEQIVENANQSEDNGNEDLSTGCLEGTQPVVTENVDQAAELAGGYKTRICLRSHAVAESRMAKI